MLFSVPLSVQVSKKKKFILNINNYRNAHFRTLSKAKELFTDYIIDLGLPPVKYGRIKAYYKIYPASKRMYDGGNVISIVDKFLMDALIKVGVIEDDNINHVECPHWMPCEPNKDNPRIEVKIVEITEIRNN